MHICKSAYNGNCANVRAPQCRYRYVWLCILKLDSALSPNVAERTHIWHLIIFGVLFFKHNARETRWIVHKTRAPAATAAASVCAAVVLQCNHQQRQFAIVVYLAQNTTAVRNFSPLPAGSRNGCTQVPRWSVRSRVQERRSDSGSSRASSVVARRSRIRSLLLQSVICVFLFSVLWMHSRNKKGTKIKCSERAICDLYERRRIATNVLKVQPGGSERITEI